MSGSIDRHVMNRRTLVFGLIAVGLCLLGVGLAWDRLVPASAYWTSEQAEELSAAQLEMHTKSHQHDADAEQQMAAARDRYKKVSAQLDRARGSQRLTGTLFLAVGVLLLVTSIVLYYSQNRNE